jgi:DtxR family transcriptional regulator, Mn-dependent transcriptional regulator
LSTVPTNSSRSSRVEEDYLRLIWKAEEWEHRGATPAELGAATGTVPSSVTGALTRLEKRGLIHREPYGSATLTDAGREIALRMVRRHRLLETFLVQHLGLGWDEVHEEAEELEHAVSDRLLDRIDDLLGNPDHDPHGDPIPDRAGRLSRSEGSRLSEFDAGTEVEIRRVSDHDSQLLRYLAQVDVAPGSRVTVRERRTFAGSLALETAAGPLDLSMVAANAIWASAV